MKKELTPIEVALQRLEVIEQARFMYCELEMPAPAIAKTLNKNVKTIYSWRDLYEWKVGHKANYVFTRNEFVELLTDILKIDNKDLQISLLSKLMKGGKQ